jgi:hypothetical protein
MKGILIGGMGKTVLGVKSSVEPVGDGDGGTGISSVDRKLRSR